MASIVREATVDQVQVLTEVPDLVSLDSEGQAEEETSRQVVAVQGGEDQWSIFSQYLNFVGDPKQTPQQSQTPENEQPPPEKEKLALPWCPFPGTCTSVFIVCCYQFALAWECVSVEFAALSMCANWQALTIMFTLVVGMGKHFGTHTTPNSNKTTNKIKNDPKHKNKDHPATTRTHKQHHDLQQHM
eukprot:15466014-Alexandrium_andersonii.AAC.1